MRIHLRADEIRSKLATLRKKIKARATTGEQRRKRKQLVRRRGRLLRRLQSMGARAHNIVTDMHRRVASHLVDQYAVIVIPKFGVQGMVRKRRQDVRGTGGSAPIEWWWRLTCLRAGRGEEECAQDRQGDGADNARAPPLRVPLAAHRHGQAPRHAGDCHERGEHVQDVHGLRAHPRRPRGGQGVQVPEV